MNAPTNAALLSDRWAALGDRGLLSRCGFSVIVGTLLVIVCYFWVDRGVAFYVHDHGLNTYRVFKWLTLPPPLVQTWSPLVLALLVLSRAWRPWSPWQQTLFVACLSLIVADEFRTSLGSLLGRYWPETWFNNNPSLIGNGTYGFHPFQSADDIGSFPSGHAARICGFGGVWWWSQPRGRVAYALLALPMLASLVLMNYHFVGDVVAGCVVGGVVSRYAVALAGLEKNGTGK